MLIVLVYKLVIKNKILSIIDKIHLNCDVIDGRVVNGLGQPKPFSVI